MMIKPSIKPPSSDGEVQSEEESITEWEIITKYLYYEISICCIYSVNY